MKLNKTNNPYGVAEGQRWKAKDKRRKAVFTVIGFGSTTQKPIVFFACVEYGKGKKAFRREINLLRFNEYIRVK
jgi:hypothetical protein